MYNHSAESKQQNILPDAAGLFYALRSMGYENTAAVADLVDNSIDAGASNIWISVDRDLSKIFIADDGCGMSEETLHTAVKLGGKKVHDDGSDLGKYGLGLITASLSMGRVVRIITKQNNLYNTAVLDYDKIRETNLFTADFHESTEGERISFDRRTNQAESGTVLIIDKCDKLQYAKSKDLINAIETAICQIFRVYLSAGKQIYLNEKSVVAYDPLLLSTRGVRRLVDTDIVVKTIDGGDAKIHVLAVQIPDQGAKINKGLQLNIKGQGFYILRNNREVASALEFTEIFKKHNDFNLLRIELGFSSDLDDVMGINLKKHDVAPSQRIINALKTVLEQPIKKMREEMKAKQRKRNATNPFLNLPPIGEPKPTGGAAPVTGSAANAGANATVFQPAAIVPEPAKKVEYEFAFSTYAGGEGDPMFRIAVAGEKVTVRYNICNPYYREKILADDYGIQVKEILDGIIESSLKAYVEMPDAAGTLTDFAEAMAKKFGERE